MGAGTHQVDGGQGRDCTCRAAHSAVQAQTGEGELHRHRAHRARARDSRPHTGIARASARVGSRPGGQGSTAARDVQPKLRQASCCTHVRQPGEPRHEAEAVAWSNMRPAGDWDWFMLFSQAAARRRSQRPPWHWTYQPQQRKDVRQPARQCAGRKLERRWAQGPAAPGDSAAGSAALQQRRAHGAHPPRDLGCIMVLRPLARAAGTQPKVGVRRLGKSLETSTAPCAQRLPAECVRRHSRGSAPVCVAREHACVDQAKGTGRARCFRANTRSPWCWPFHSHSY